MNYNFRAFLLFHHIQTLFVTTKHFETHSSIGVASVCSCSFHRALRILVAVAIAVVVVAIRLVDYFRNGFTLWR